MIYKWLHMINEMIYWRTYEDYWESQAYEFSIHFPELPNTIFFEKNTPMWKERV